MSVPIRPGAGRPRRRIRTLVPVALVPVALVEVALVLAATACGSPAPLAPSPGAGQPAGSVVVTTGTDLARAVDGVQQAVTAGGGTITAVVDHAAEAGAAGVRLAPSTVVIASSPRAQAPLLRAGQQAAANLPERYLLRGAPDGSVTLTFDGADYVAAVSGVIDPGARTVLRDTTAAVADGAAPGAATPAPSPLVGVTPTNYLITVPGDADVPTTVERLRTGVTRGTQRVVAAVDLTVGTGGAGPPIRPTTTVFVSTPAIESPLLALEPSLGLDLPMRFVVWQDATNRTQIGYPDVTRVAARHGLPADDRNIATLAIDADRLALRAAGPAT